MFKILLSDMYLEIFFGYSFNLPHSKWFLLLFSFFLILPPIFCCCRAVCSSCSRSHWFSGTSAHAWLFSLMVCYSIFIVLRLTQCMHVLSQGLNVRPWCSMFPRLAQYPHRRCVASWNCQQMNRRPSKSATSTRYVDCTSLCLQVRLSTTPAIAAWFVPGWKDRVRLNILERLYFQQHKLTWTTAHRGQPVQ